MESIKDTASWGALIGAVLPFLIAVVNQPRWSKIQRQVISVAVSVVGGIGTVIVSGNFDPQNWLLTIVAVIGAAQASYALVWNPSGLTDVVERNTVVPPGENGAITVLEALLVVLVVIVLLLILGVVPVDPHNGP